jgi:hypothetical protein
VTYLDPYVFGHPLGAPQFLEEVQYMSRIWQESPKLEAHFGPKYTGYICYIVAAMFPTGKHGQSDLLRPICVWAPTWSTTISLRGAVYSRIGEISDTEPHNKSPGLVKKNADNCDVLHCIGMALVLVDLDSKNIVLDIGMISGISIFDEGNGHHGIQGNGPKSGAIKRPGGPISVSFPKNIS